MLRVIALLFGMVLAANAQSLGGESGISNSSNSKGGLPPAGPFFTTFDPATAFATLSNGDLSASVTGGVGTYLGARTISSVSTGKYYWEISTVTTGTTSTQLGIANSSAAIGSVPLAYLGIDTNSLGLFDNGQVFINNALVATVASLSGTVVVDCALDAGAKLAWFSVNGGNWNNSPSANPATGVGGIDISLITGPYFAAWADNLGPNTAVANFGPVSSFVRSPPVGFTTLPGPTSPPAQAVAWGLNTLLWDATLSNYDANNTKAAGFDLYLNNAFPSSFANGVAAWTPIITAPATHAGDVSYSGGNLTLATDRSGIAEGLNSCVWNGSSVIGRSFIPPFYIEVIMSFNPATSTTGAIANNAWPIIWMVPMEFFNGSITTQDFVELDNMEAFPSSMTNAIIVPDANNHDWNNNSAINNTVSPGVPTQAQIGTNLPNRYGRLNIPKASNAGTGIVATYFNDGHILADTNYTATGGASPAATPSNPNGTLSALDGKHYCLLLGAGQNWPITVSRIRVWGP